MISEETKNNLFDKQMKEDKEKEFYRTYLNSLGKKPNNNFSLDYFKKNNEFKPIIYKHPENLYLKAVSDYRINKEKLKKYNKKTGQYDLYLNRTRTNKFYINAQDKKDTNIDDKDSSYNKLKTSNNNLSSRNSSEIKNNNQYKKKNLYINVSKGSSSNNKFLTSNSAYQRKYNSTQKYFYPVKKSNNDDISINEMINFVLEKEDEKMNKKNYNLSNHIKFRKYSQKKKNIINSINDPSNPYSALFYNNVLYSNYKVGMHYINLEQGVPFLRIKKIKKASLPPLNERNKNDKNKLFCNTYSSGFNINNKKKMIILPVESNNFNKSNSSNKKSNKKDNDNNKKKDTDKKVLFQSYGQSTDFINNDVEMPKFDGENKDKITSAKDKQEKMKLSGIIEEEN